MIIISNCHLLFFSSTSSLGVAKSCSVASSSGRSVDKKKAIKMINSTSRYRSHGGGGGGGGCITLSGTVRKVIVVKVNKPLSIDRMCVLCFLNEQLGSPDPSIHK